MDRIIEVEKKYQVPKLRKVKPVEEIPDPFQPEPAGKAATPGAGNGKATEGMDFAQFFYVAAGCEEIREAKVRKSVEGYGPKGGMDWQPFYPDVKRAVAHIATEVAGREGFYYELMTLDDKLLEKLQEAQRLDKVALIIMDVWSLSLQKYRDWVSPLDNFSSANYSVLMPRHEKDPENQNDKKPQGVLLLAFPNRYVLPDLSNFVTWAKNEADFGAKLQDALRRVQSRILQKKIDQMPEPLPTERREPPSISSS